METKGQLIESVKEWVKLDNEIRNIQKIQKEKKKEKEEISKSLMSIMKENEIEAISEVSVFGASGDENLAFGKQVINPEGMSWNLESITDGEKSEEIVPELHCAEQISGGGGEHCL